MPSWIVFRIDLLIRAIIKTFCPYIVTALITMLAFGVWLCSLATFSDNKEMTLVKSRFIPVMADYRSDSNALCHANHRLLLPPLCPHLPLAVD